MVADAAVLVPVKAFDAAKSRLAAVLDEGARAVLARAMATRVLRAAGDLPVTVACDDDGVAAWAVAAGATVVWTGGLDLNGSVRAGLDSVLDGDAAPGHVLVAHADLPFAESLEPLAAFDGATVVPDRRDDGTNVLCLPAGAARWFVPQYGPGSFARHLEQLGAARVAVRVVRRRDLQWDVDEPGDLPAP